MNIQCRSIWLIRILATILCSISSVPICAQYSLRLHPTIHSIGVEVQLPTGSSTKTTPSAELSYREIGGKFQQGYPPTFLIIDSVQQFRGSVYEAASGTSYEIRITLISSLGDTLITLQDTTTTKQDPSITPTQIIKYVSPQGSGTEYSYQQPGSLPVLLSGDIACGTTIILKGGRYDIGELYLNLQQQCSESTPILFMAADNETPVLSGGDDEQYSWVRAEDTSVFVTTIRKELEYNALMMMDSIRLYPYPFLKSPDIQPSYPSLMNLGYDVSGFYRKGNLVYCKTVDNKNPNQSHIIFSKRFTCLTIDGNSKNNYLQFKGITFEYYGKGKCDIDIFDNPTQCYPSWTLRLLNTNHVTVDSCIFNYTNFPISFNGSCSGNVVQRCTITDQTGWWSHGAFKQTRETLYLEPGSYGRYLENCGIMFAPSDGGIMSGNIIQHNVISGVVSGIAVGASTPNYRIYDTDISGNVVSNCYDGIDVTSIMAAAGCINTRIWNNEIHHCPVAFSLILPQWGPTTIFRNVAHHISERKNHNFDVFFADCDNSISDKIWGTGLKVNTGEVNANPGSMFLFHNTFHSTDELGFPMYLWKSTWKNFVSRNNIYYSEGKSCLFFDDVQRDSVFSFDSQGDNFWNPVSGKIAILQPQNGVAKCEFYSSVTALESGLKLATKSPLITISGYTLEPQFIGKNDFHLSAKSELIDKGVIIQGINDNSSNQAPDIGAYEMNQPSDVIEDSKSSEVTIVPNPFSDSFTISSLKPMAKIRITSATGAVIEQRKVHGNSTVTWEGRFNTSFNIVTIYFTDGSILHRKLISLK
jgi:hypothetical protein